MNSRGFTDETIEREQLGFVAEPMPGHEPAAGRLAIPYLTPSGPVAIRFRCLRDHVCNDRVPRCPKYWGEQGQQSHLFGVLSFKADSPVIAITEGELDRHIAVQCGIPTIGTPGAKSWRPFWRLCFEGYQEVVILADGDEAGRVFAKKVAGELYDSRIVEMPPGLDVNSFVLANGAEALRERARLVEGHEGEG